MGPTKDTKVQHKKPTILQRLTRSGMPRQQAQMTVGEQLAKVMMRRRARECLHEVKGPLLLKTVHYVETRDDLELKVAKINRRLQKLAQEGERVSSETRGRAVLIVSGASSSRRSRNTLIALPRRLTSSRPRWRGSDVKRVACQVVGPDVIQHHLLTFSGFRAIESQQRTRGTSAQHRERPGRSDEPAVRHAPLVSCRSLHGASAEMQHPGAGAGEGGDHECLRVADQPRAQRHCRP